MLFSSLRSQRRVSIFLRTRRLTGPLPLSASISFIAALYRTYRDCRVRPIFSLNPSSGLSRSEPLVGRVGSSLPRPPQADCFSSFLCFLQFVDEGLEVVFFKNASGVAQMKGKFEGGSVSDSGVDMSADGKAK